MLKVKAIIEKAPEIKKSKGRSTRYYVTFKIRGSEQIEIDRQDAFSMQEFVDEVQEGDTIVIRTHFYSVSQEENKLKLSPTFKVIGISKNSKEYIDYEILSQTLKRSNYAKILAVVWIIFLSLYYREIDEIPQIYGKKIKFSDALAFGILIIFFLSNFL